MPLRISESYDSTEVDHKKAHKMSRRGGHYQKVRRPTNLEVYNDAAKILEELLEKRMDRVQRQRRNKTDPNTQKVLDTLTLNDGPENNPVARSKTMPSKYRESPNISINSDAKKEKEALIRRDEKRERQRNDDGNVSSADTEGEDDVDDSLKKRKKKSLFKLAKERLIHTFNRDQKAGLGNLREKESPNTRRRKPKKKSDKSHGEVVSETTRHIKAHLNHDNSVDYLEEVEYRNAAGSSIHSDVHLRNSRSSSFSRKSLINTIKKPFTKPDKHSKNKLDHKHATSPSLPYPALPSSATPIPEEGNRSQSHGPTLPPPPGASSPRTTGGTSSSKSTSPSPKHDADTIPGPPGGFSSSSSVLPMSDHNSVGSLSNVHPSIQSNILDSPGEDIEFMDIDESDKRGNADGAGPPRGVVATGMKFHTSEGLLNFNWLADQTADLAKSLDYEIDERKVSRLRPDGGMETTTTVTATRTVVMANLLEVEERDEIDGEEAAKPMDKEELYGKIAQKLIAMADTYSVSDTEGIEATPVPGDAPLTDLEKEIIACLRSKDKYSKELEDKIMETANSRLDDAYQRFHTTIQNSLGTELSWNHLAFLFYTTKGVVSAMGKGSQAANQAKDFTLQYISDTFASWIMDQGGFDSMLSSSESDPEVD